MVFHNINTASTFALLFKLNLNKMFRIILLTGCIGGSQFLSFAQNNEDTLKVKEIVEVSIIGGNGKKIPRILEK